jgi:NADH pyrophosphatase NudC (nudix superfamily)
MGVGFVNPPGVPLARGGRQNFASGQARRENRRKTEGGIKKMRQQDFDSQWIELSLEVMSGMKEWRVQHPRATLVEMEAVLNERLGTLRRRMIEDMAQASAATDWGEAVAGEKPLCPECGQPLQRRGKEERELQTQGGQTINLKRRYGTCPQCDAGFFPLG